MTATALGAAQRETLNTLQLTANEALTAAELTESSQRRTRYAWPTVGVTRAALKSLEKRGLVEALGHASTGGRCWKITAAGLDVAV